MTIEQINHKRLSNLDYFGRIFIAQVIATLINHHFGFGLGIYGFLVAAVCGVISIASFVVFPLYYGVSK